MKKAEKEFDSVRLMRTTRDSLSRKLQGLTFEQERQLIEERLQPRAPVRADAG